MLHSINRPHTQRVVFQSVHKILSSFFSSPFDVLSLAVLLVVELADCHFTADCVDTVVKVFFYLCFFFPQRYIITLSSRCLVCRYKFPRIDKLWLSVYIGIFINVSSVFSLALSITQIAIFTVFSFYIRHSVKLLSVME
ncbi:putative membrane protein [Clostridioides difficile DA00211]|nr:putative membrane protein [Clostridioides difficile DA00211]